MLHIRTFVLLQLLSNSVALSQTVEDRIAAILSKMTLEEKILQLHQEGSFNTADNARLAIPGFFMADGPHGVRDGLATSFPVGIGMASTWDTDLARRVGVAMGEEFRGKGKHQALGPCLDIDRDPRNGRSPETGGEDPYLCAQITTAVVKGIQSTPCIATVKHFNANHRENGRTSNNIIASRRTLNEQAGLAFRTAIQEGGALSVMNAYNLINGEKCAENSTLLTTILRTQWGFPFYVVSDWGSIWSTERAIKAGCDVCMGSDDYKNNLPSLVGSGAVPLPLIDEAVRRVLRTKILAGMLDYQPAGNPADVNSEAHRALCLEAGRKSLVLLKNQDGILPLNRTLSAVALVGPSAAVAQIDGSGSAYVSPFYTVSPRQGIEAKIGTSKVLYAKGCDINSADTSGFADAVAAAKAADVVIYCGGLDPSQEGEGFDRVGGSTALPGTQQHLINALAAANPNLVVALFSGGACSLAACVNNIKALVYAFYPGQEGGNALADVLFGDYNPGGKLPVTIPVNDGQLPAWNDNFTDDYGCGYRWFDKKGFLPQFPFGFGLSFTTFSYSNLSISPASPQPGEPVTVRVDVTNSGSRSGEEVVEVYLSDAASTVEMPVKELKAFRRVALDPGEMKTEEFTLSADELSYYDETGNAYTIEAGVFRVRVGGSSDNLPLEATFAVSDGERKPDLRITRLWAVPPYPVQAQPVTFLATVKNQGSAATTPGTPLQVKFLVNGQEVCASDEFTGSIPVCGSALICANTGPDGTNMWTPPGIGDYQVMAYVDPGNSIAECVETNNTCTGLLRVSLRPPTNLALRKPVTTTSVERAGLEGDKAVDGNMSTRWSSAFSDPQMISVDLGAVYQVGDVRLYWESAYARDYYVMVSDGVGPFSTVKHETNGDGGIDEVPVNMPARQVRIIGMQRATEWGYSLYEIEVLEKSATGTEKDPAASVLPERFRLFDNYPNPFNPSTTISYELPQRSSVKVQVYNVLGECVATLADGIQSPGHHRLSWTGGAASGIYCCRLVAIPLDPPGTRFSATRKMLLVR